VVSVTPSARWPAGRRSTPSRLPTIAISRGTVSATEPSSLPARTRPGDADDVNQTLITGELYCGHEDGDDHAQRNAAGGTLSAEVRLTIMTRRESAGRRNALSQPASDWLLINGQRRR
jgi:hypothetical protein